MEVLGKLARAADTEHSNQRGGSARPLGCARCGAGAGCSAIKYQSFKQVMARIPPVPHALPGDLYPGEAVQGYLTYKKTHPPRTLP